MSWLLALLSTCAQASAPRTVTIEPGFELAGHRLGDLDGDGDAELVVVARDGRVRAFRPLSAEPGRALGELALATPERALLDLAAWDGKPYLIAETPRGTLAYPVDAEGAVAAEGATWIPRARLELRLRGPSFARIAQDVNRDGVNDLLVPTLGGIELWLAAVEPGKPPSFRKAATVAVEVRREAGHRHAALSDELRGSLSIPGLDTSDVNGDGRPDLVVAEDQRRAWHLQRADASFPLEPDVTLDLSIFRDTTPPPSNTFGGTASSGDEARLQSRDLDGDTVPDYVIQHQRKVWVFLGGPGGPQFAKPSEVLILAEDITALLVQPLDDDERPDLLFVKLQIPTVATLLRGLFGEWDVAVRALGYKNAGGGKFETRPNLENDLALRLPGIVGLMKNPESFTRRFEELGQRFRGGARGDVDGDGGEDLCLVTPDQASLELWRGSAEPAAAARGSWLREVLFDERDAVWDIDRVLTTLGGLADREAARLTGGRAADERLPLRDPAAFEVVAIECADLDGDGAREVLVAWRSRTGPQQGFDVLCFSAPR